MVSRMYRWCWSVLCILVLIGWSVGCSPAIPPGQDGQNQTDAGNQTDGGSSTDVTSTDTPSSGCTSDTDCKEAGKPKCANGTCVSECSVDKDCTDPSRPQCTNGKCESLPPECIDEKDCKNPAKPVCKNSTCAPCTTDSDCKNPSLPLCSNGACVSKAPECTTNKDCQDPTKPVCSNGICTPKAPECTTDKDCQDPTKPVCNNGGCVAKTPECRANTDCKDPAKPVCTNGVCGPKAPECKANTDCKDPSKPVCTNGTCVAKTPECRTNTDCKDPSKPVCTNGTCGPKTPPTCKSNQDCASPTPLCNTTTQACVPGECEKDTDCSDPTKSTCVGFQCVPECKTNADCASSRPVCEKGRCVAAGGCSSDKDCAISSVGSYCDLSARQCRQCLVDKHCKANEFCDIQSFTCKAQPDVCKTDTDCKAKDPKLPFCVNARCVQCKGASDCPALNACVAGNCQFVGCSSDTDCSNDPNGKYCAAKKCVVCTKDSHCNAGDTCNTQTYTCQKQASCNQHSDCKAPTPYCDNTSKSCAVCTQDSHCPKDPNAKSTAQCKNSQCVGCSQSLDCEFNYLCTAGKCVEGCIDKRDCSVDKPICSTTLKKCIACEKDTDCSGNDVCDSKTNTCLFRCTANDAYDVGCAQRGQPYYCNSQTRQCVSCIAKPTAPGSVYDIGCNSTAPKCDATAGKCVVCTTDSHCPSGRKCDTKTKTCYECLQDTDCRRGYVCDNNAKVCVLQCVDTNCPRGQACGDYNRCADCSSKSPLCPTGLVCDQKANACVECLADTDCKNGAKCDTGINKCLVSTGRMQCLPCSKSGGQAECAAGYGCVDAPLGYTSSTTQKETVCLKSCKIDTDCEQGYTCCSDTNSTCNSVALVGLKGYCYPRYTQSYNQVEGYIYYRSCKAVLTQGKSCTLNSRTASCGHGAFNNNPALGGDAICSQGSQLCRLTCLSNNECVKGYTCQCPVGTTLRGYYCYDAINQYFYPRCTP